MTIKISHNPQSECIIYSATLKDGNNHPLLKIGACSYGHEFFIHWDGELCQIEIGNYSSIAQEVHFFAGQEHNIDWGSTYPFTHLPTDWPELRELKGHPLSRGNILIGNDVWIGYGALIRSGVTVHDGAVVGMGSVVTRDVPAYAIVAGNPARLVRYRFSSEIISELIYLKWWNWPKDMVRILAPLLSQRMNKNTLKTMHEFQKILS